MVITTKDGQTFKGTRIAFEKPHKRWFVTLKTTKGKEIATVAVRDVATITPTGRTG